MSRCMSALKRKLIPCSHTRVPESTSEGGRDAHFAGHDGHSSWFRLISFHIQSPGGGPRGVGMKCYGKDPLHGILPNSPNDCSKHARAIAHRFYGKRSPDPTTRVLLVPLEEDLYSSAVTDLLLVASEEL